MCLLVWSAVTSTGEKARHRTGWAQTRAAGEEGVSGRHVRVRLVGRSGHIRPRVMAA